MENVKNLQCETEETSGGGALRVLVVEDDPLVGRAVVRVFRRYGIEATLVSNPDDITQLSVQFDVGIFDIDLPEKNGVDLAAQCRARGLVKQVLFFSATSDDRRIAAAKELGEFIDKGDGAAVLVERVLWLTKRTSGIYKQCCTTTVAAGQLR